MSKSKVSKINIQLWQHCLANEGGLQPDWKAVAATLLEEVLTLRQAARAKPKPKPKQ